MKDMIEYKGYYGSVHYEAEDVLFYGKVEFIQALVSYEAEDAKGIKRAFEEAVDDYLELCESRGDIPETPFKGSFNVRIGNTLHREVAIAAKEKGMTINNFTKAALEQASNNPDFMCNVKKDGSSNN